MDSIGINVLIRGGVTYTVRIMTLGGTIETHASVTPDIIREMTKLGYTVLSLVNDNFKGGQ